MRWTLLIINRLLITPFVWSGQVSVFLSSQSYKRSSVCEFQCSVGSLDLSNPPSVCLAAGSCFSADCWFGVQRSSAPLQQTSCVFLLTQRHGRVWGETCDCLRSLTPDWPWHQRWTWVTIITWPMRRLFSVNVIWPQADLSHTEDQLTLFYWLVSMSAWSHEALRTDGSGYINSRAVSGGHQAWHTEQHTAAQVRSGTSAERLWTTW